MIRTGILNPAIHSLLCRVRHTNTVVIADRGFPYWPAIETVDISLVDDIPTVLEVLRAIHSNFVVGRAFMASEFQAPARADALETLTGILAGAPLEFEPHTEFKKRVPQAIGLIRTGDTMPYSNIILESA